MPDSSEPGRERPERPDPSTPAPERLRRRVLARVNAERQPSGPPAPHRQPRPRGSGRRTVALALLTCAAAGLGLVLLISAGDSGAPRAARAARGAAPARASLLRSGGRAELQLAAMPQPPVGEVYEVWLAGAGRAPRPTDALFTPTSAGTAAVEVPGTLRGVGAITVTAEPRGGSSRPTGPVLLRVELSPAAG